MRFRRAGLAVATLVAICSQTERRKEARQRHERQIKRDKGQRQLAVREVYKLALPEIYKINNNLSNKSK